MINSLSHRYLRSECISIVFQFKHDGSDRDTEYGSPNDLNDRTRIYTWCSWCTSSPAVARAGKVIPNESPWPLRHNRSLSRYHACTEETWPTGSQADVPRVPEARVLATRRSTLPVILDARLCEPHTPTGFQSPFCQKCVLSDSEARPWLHFPPRRCKLLRYGQCN